MKTIAQTKVMEILKLAALALTVVLTAACGKSGSESAKSEELPAIVAPASRCSTTIYRTWESQRNCLVSGYQTDVNRCLALTDATRRGECVQLVRTAYVGVEDTSLNSWGSNWSLYSTSLDPYYQSLSAYNTNWASRYQMDVWANYYQRAAVTTYYNQAYLAAYQRAYANYWYGGYGYYY